MRRQSSLRRGVLSKVGAAALLLSSGLVAAAGCGSDTGDENTVAGAGGTGATGGGGSIDGGGGTGAVGSGPCSTQAECLASEFCSAAKKCVPTGACAHKDDCASGNKCSFTGKCIPEGSCETNADCTAGMECDANQQCVPGGGCGAEPFAIEAVAPNLFISLDRSCSMNNTAGGALPKTKWAIAVDAINKLTTDFTGKIRFGLAMFPDTVTPNCAQAAPAVAVGDNNETTIQTLLTAALAKADPNFPDGPCVTNIDTAMDQASKEPAFADKTRPSYALLITDGAQAGCNAAGGDPGTEQIITTMAAAGVKTFVVGFGAGIDAAQMNKFAIAGGVPKNDPTQPNTKYYQADDAKSLDAALATIAGSIVGCSFTLAKVPPDPSKLFVFFDGQPLPRDPTHTQGWDYDASTNQVTFYGVDCDKLKTQQVKKVDVVFGCNTLPPS